MRRVDLISGLASMAIHGAIFAVGGFLLFSPARFAIEPGQNSTEVDLVAAPPEPESEPPREENTPPSPPIVPPVPAPPPDAMLQPEPVKNLPPSLAPVLAKPTRKEIVREKGDGSSPRPGHDATSAHSAHGASVSARPDYLRNPPPVYPEESRRAQEQGVVLLSVQVNADGAAESVSVRQTSGYPRLDAAALHAVRNWKFKPATAGGIPVPCQIEVPVHFELRN